MPAGPPDTCGHCGTAIPPDASACPECGAAEDTGWEDDYSSDLGLLDEDFDYDEFVEREFGKSDNPNVVPQGLHWFWWLVGIGLIATLVLMWA